MNWLSTITKTAKERKTNAIYQKIYLQYHEIFIYLVNNL